MYTRIGSVAVGTCICVVPPIVPFPATGVVVTGDPKFLQEGLPVAVGGMSIVMFPCGTSIIVPIKTDFLLGGIPVSSPGDTTVGCGMGTITL